MENPFQLILDRLDAIDRKLELLQSTGIITEPVALPELLTTKELCKLLGVSEPTIIRYKQKGKIPFIQVGSVFRFNRNEVLKALEYGKDTKGFRDYKQKP